MSEGSGTITIDPKVLKEFRKFVAEKYEGRTYGVFKEEVEQALIFWMKENGWKGGK